MKKHLKCRLRGAASALSASLLFLTMLQACGGNGQQTDADAVLCDGVCPSDPAGDEGEAPVDMPAEDAPPGDPVADELPAETVDSVEGDSAEEDPAEGDSVEGDSVEEDSVEELETVDVPEDEVEEADAAELECTPPMIYHPAFDTCVSTQDLGADCTDGGCHAGQDCVEYYGIAGIEYHQCYISCGPRPDRLCPGGYSCVDIADGPANVCIK